MEIKVYHNPRCSKSRAALAYLDNKGIDYKVIKYLDEPLTNTDLKNLLDKLKISASDLIRKNESIFKDHYKGLQLSEDQLIDAMIEYPKLIERPIVVKGNQAVIARPTEKIEGLLK